MDAWSPAATWIITIACAVLASMVVAVSVAFGAYTIGKLAGKLKSVEKGAVVAPVAPVAVMASTEAPVHAKESESSDESDESDEEEEEEKEEEVEEETSRKKKKGKGKKKEVKKKVKDADWEWPVYDTWWSDMTYRQERKLRAKEKAKPKSAPFEVTYEKKRGWPDEVSVALRSKALIQVARKCIPEEPGTFIVEEPKVDGRDMFLALESFREAYRATPEDETALGRHHLRHLIRFLETEYKDTIVQVESAAHERKAAWGLLWAFLHKGQEVYYKCAMTGQTLKGVVFYNYYYKSSEGKHLQVKLKSRNWNGRRYVSCFVKVTVDEFRSEKSFEAIGICPFSILSETEVADLNVVFLRNGEKFYDIVSRGSYYMRYEGPRLRMVLVNTCWQLKMQKADGRVMADLLSFARMNPGYPLKNAAPPTSCTPGALTCCDTERPSDEELRLAPAIVYGFSFSNKQWGAFDVSGFSEIDFDDAAFDRELVLSNPSRKQMLFSLVSEYLRDPVSCGEELAAQHGLDPISNKGDGCIFLCYGPPGTGKTLTAESMAEKLHRPLWSISVFELGTSANELETNLIEILDIASQWRAVLLLDEADIYMEKRTSQGDPSRTAMTAIFLRLLEYYRGVLFLTTNRVASFDDAFCSRISMFLRYHRLAGAQREAVWSNMLAKAGIASPDLGPFLETQLNGREIRNTIRIAQTWAKSSGEILTTGHVLEVVRMLGEFRQDLEGAIKDESDERSISRALAKVRSIKGGSDSDLNGNFVKVTASEDEHAAE